MGNSILDIDLVNSKAILVGTSSVKDDSLHNIPLVKNNVEDFRNILIDSNYFGFVNDNVIQLIDQTANNILKTIETLSSNIRDTLIFYFSGHALNYSNDLLLTGTDSDFNIKISTCLSFNSIIKIFKNCQIKKKIIILDCCYSGTVLNILGSNQTFLSSQADKIKGFCFLTSCKSTEVSGFDFKERNTEYSGSLFRVLKHGISNDRRYLTIPEIHREIINKFTNRFSAIHGNTPQLLHNFDSEFKLVKNIAAQTGHATSNKTPDISLLARYALQLLGINKAVEYEADVKMKEAMSLTLDRLEIVELINQNITDSVKYARRIQKSLLNSETLFKHYSNSFILDLPKDIVSGDFYFIDSIANKIIIVISDCTGHGVPGALLTTLGIYSIKKVFQDNYKKVNLSAADILENLSEEFAKMASYGNKQYESYDGMDIAVCLIDTDSQKLSFSGASLNLVYFNRFNEIFVLKGSRNSLILGGDCYKFDNTELYISEVSSLYLYTDGFDSQFGGSNGKKYLLRNLHSFLTKIQEESMPQQMDRLLTEHERWRGDYEQIDDILILGIKFHEEIQVSENKKINTSEEILRCNPGNKIEIEHPEPYEFKDFILSREDVVNEKILSIKQTPKSPLLNCNKAEGIINIIGRSIPENSCAFYSPLIWWVKNYCKNPQPKTIVNIQLEYFNTSSSRYILDFFKIIESIHNISTEIIINWIYPNADEDLLEAGRDYESILKVPFKFIESLD